ncbi:hypothetical protein UA19_01169 [Burkholderia multivorans]|nr:hypothetical protein NP80_2179 [Burkholderia multivorans ATCC BAA-247]SAK15461.1 hypothetical protein UA21_01172 [Burkholderia multivorans]SAK15494.1 hypothetical protein UA19_01169 [Burkholderia multivorans]SPU80339.1 Uncharacterised protein [Burkholderia multivorans]
MYKISTTRRKSRLSLIDRPSPPSIIGRIDVFFRHPTIVVAVGFFLSGIVGTWLTHLNDVHQKARDAIIRNQDTFREAMDDFQVGADTIAAGINHVILRFGTFGKAASLQRAEQDYLSSYAIWVQKFAKDRNIIEQQFSNTPFKTEISGILTNVQGGIEVLDYCIQYHIASAYAFDDHKPRSVECKLNDTSVINVQALLMNLRICTHTITVTLRPDPRFDFATEEDARALLNVKMNFIRQYCPANKIAAGTDAPIASSGLAPST